MTKQPPSLFEDTMTIPPSLLAFSCPLQSASAPPHSQIAVTVTVTVPSAGSSSSLFLRAALLSICCCSFVCRLEDGDHPGVGIKVRQAEAKQRLLARWPSFSPSLLSFVLVFATTHIRTPTIQRHASPCPSVDAPRFFIPLGVRTAFCASPGLFLSSLN
ncbi:uncharacterized protein IWZ02DRAFT_456468 [Phyllosticta citriasiana]|uniref:uncharacterized protein n=1 Tax=Phyllosticta citriasiana TaxID=595635 RepID=UPI0030FD3FFA